MSSMDLPFAAAFAVDEVLRSVEPRGGERSPHGRGASFFFFDEREVEGLFESMARGVTPRDSISMTSRDGVDDLGFLFLPNLSLLRFSDFSSYVGFLT